MIYLERFSLATADDEDTFVLNYPYQLEMQCFTHNVYPFKIIPQKELEILEFEPITIFYGSNGSGKSTLLNIIAEKLMIRRSAPFNNTPYFDDYLSYCEYSLRNQCRLPKDSKLIASDDVFDFLLDIRAINEGISDRRDRLFEEYEDKSRNRFQMKCLDDYDELKKHNDAKRYSKSQFTEKRLPREVTPGSNGESAFAYFAKEIGENALYLLDEPENSLSVVKQKELARLLEDSARFYNCQFIISTHSPILLSMKGARIYDLDSCPVRVRRWTELENVREWFDFFEENRDKLL
ncbi:MAG: ATP-binding cassette domain-containing protein [Ruminococcaceae bacterium]|nr:ATP-binding cassette domain-containing protein [Oscillospiraceae bacterium]